MDNAGRLFLRYTIPGVVCLFWLGLTDVVMRAGWRPATQNVEIVDDAALVAVAASIGLGFLVYQFYYCSYAPFFLGRRFVAADRGGDVMASLKREDRDRLRNMFGTRVDHRIFYRPAARLWGRLRFLELDEQELKRCYPDPADAPTDDPLAETEYPACIDDRPAQAIFSEQWYANWDVVGAFLNLAGEDPGVAELKREYTMRSDIYHGLGATRIALVVAWLVALLHTVIWDPSVGSHVADFCLGALVSAGATAGAAVVMHVMRQRAWRSLRNHLRFGMRHYFDSVVNASEIDPLALAKAAPVGTKQQ